MRKPSVLDESNFKVETIATDKPNQDEIMADIFWLSLLAYHEKEQPNHVNMDVVHWENKGYTLMYKIYEEKLFVRGRGRLTLLYNGPQLIALAGVYRSKFDPNVFIGGSRSWVMPRYLGHSLVARHLIPQQIETAKGMGGKSFIITFNEGQRVLTSEGKLGQTLDFPNAFRREQPEAFNDMYLHPHKVRLTASEQPQNVLIKDLEKGYKPKFLELKPLPPPRRI